MGVSTSFTYSSTGNSLDNLDFAGVDFELFDRGFCLLAVRAEGLAENRDGIVVDVFLHDMR